MDEGQQAVGEATRNKTGFLDGKCTHDYIVTETLNESEK